MALFFIVLPYNILSLQLWNWTSVAVESSPLGEWMWFRKKSGMHIKVPININLKNDHGIKSGIDALTLKMLCPEAKERIPIEFVCEGLEIVKGVYIKYVFVILMIT